MCGRALRARWGCAYTNKYPSSAWLHFMGTHQRLTAHFGRIVCLKQPMQTSKKLKKIELYYIIFFLPILKCNTCTYVVP